MAGSGAPNSSVAASGNWTITWPAKTTQHFKESVLTQAAECTARGAVLVLGPVVDIGDDCMSCMPSLSTCKASSFGNAATRGEILSLLTIPSLGGAFSQAKNRPYREKNEGSKHYVILLHIQVTANIHNITTSLLPDYYLIAISLLPHYDIITTHY